MEKKIPKLSFSSVKNLQYVGNVLDNSARQIENYILDNDIS